MKIQAKYIKALVVCVWAIGSVAVLMGVIEASTFQIHSQQWSWPLNEPTGKQNVFVGRYPGGGFGAAIAAGDVNGDGFEDLIVGARFVSTEVRAEGEVYVLPGPLAFGQVITMPRQTAMVLQGATQDSQLGVYLDSGDLNGDGYDDIAVGSTWPNGATYVFLGSPDITITLPATVTLTPGTVALTLLHPEGLGLLTCDLNGDLYDDLFVGSDFDVWGILGTPQLSMTDPLTINVATDTVDVSIVGFEPNSGHWPGRGNLGCGDVDGDGYDDLVVGAFGESPDGRYNAGRVYIIRGSPEITHGHPITIEMPAQADVLIEGIDGGSYISQQGDGLGESLAVADVDADGRADLILGAPYGDGPQNSLGDAGEVYLWLGRELSGQTIDLGTEAEWVLHGDTAGDMLGVGIHTGDFDGDGRAEVLFGCENCNRQDVWPYVCGGGYVIDADQLQGTHNISQAASLVIYPSAASAYVGHTTGAVDLDADGFDDVILATSHPGLGDRPGKAFVIFYPIRYRQFLPLILK